MKHLSNRVVCSTMLAAAALFFPIAAQAQSATDFDHMAKGGSGPHPTLTDAEQTAAFNHQEPRRLNRLAPAVRVNDGFAIVRPNDLGELGFSASLIGNYTYLPQSYTITDQNKENWRYYVVEHQVIGHIGLSFGLWRRLSIDVGVPIQVWNRGPNKTDAPDQMLAYIAPPFESFEMGDMQAGLRVRIWGENDDPFAIGLYAGAMLPTAQWLSEAQDTNQKYFGSPNVRGEVKILLEGRPTDRLNIDGNIGGIFGQPKNVMIDAKGYKKDLKFDQELNWGLGVSYYFLEDKNLSLHAEGFGTFMSFEELAKPEMTHIEVLGGIKYLTDFGLGVGLAGGMGLGSGFGTPVARALFTLGWMTKSESDLDKDGIPDKIDQCPEIPEDKDGFQDEDGCPDPDNDNDGILDEADQCPLEAEDFDQFQDEDGCPDPDNDNDGVLDVNDKCPLEPGKAEFEGCPRTDQDKDGIPDDVDKCPTQPEDKDGFQDEDGCPDSDNDGDGILDEADKCPNEPGPKSNNGCPIKDRDKDGIPDHLDKCPDEPETYNGVDDEDGCPDGKSSVEVTERAIKINETIYFATGKATIKRQSFQLLDTVANVLNRYEQITKVRVEGHTDDVGRDSANLKLSKARAKSVREYLINKGVDPNRIESEGYGEEQPLCTDLPELMRTRKLARKNRKEIKECRAINRRVEFQVIEVNHKPVDGNAVIKVKN